MKHSSTTHGLWAIGAVLLLVPTLQADTLLLTDGRRVQGEVISVQDGVVEFQEEFSNRTIRIRREQLTGIEFNRINRTPPRATPTQDNARPRGLREKQLMVVANTAWTDTGINVRAGQNIYFEAQGEIRWGPNRRATASGERNSPNNSARPMPNRPGASLIGSVGETNEFFFLGDDRGAIQMRRAGRLYLGINDDNLADNTGYFQVIVYY